MADPDSERADEGGSGSAPPDGSESAGMDGSDGSSAAGSGESEDLTEAELRERVEEKYDFEDFGPRDMDEMTAEEWEVAFDAGTWITGDELLDRVKADLQALVADRQVFAVVEDVEEAGQRRLLAYSDEGYALVYPDGSVAGFGTVLRDVKPVVALCSMESYDPREPPADPVLLPDPGEVPQGSGEFGNLMLQVVAGIQLLAGLVLVGAWLYYGLSVLVPVAGLLFFGIGIVLLTAVANARLSDRFRAEEYRERLRSVGLADGERPEFLPVEDGEVLPPGERPAEEDGAAAPKSVPGADDAGPPGEGSDDAAGTGPGDGGEGPDGGSRTAGERASDADGEGEPLTDGPTESG